MIARLSKYKHVIITFVALGTGVFAGTIIGNHTRKVTDVLDSFETRGQKQQLINPLIDCQISQELARQALKPFDTKLNHQIKRNINDGLVLNMSVYYKDLNSGFWINTNNSESYTSASIMKVPLLITYLKLAQNDPDILNQTITYQTPLNEIPNLTDENIALKIGNSYSVQELINRMIIHSDNLSKELLYNHLEANNPDFLFQTYSDLGVTPDKSYRATPKEIAGFFRILYNASYLNQELSQTALKLLTQTDFSEGLVKGLPDNLTIAHKFGFMQNDFNNTLQLHDCGIIYHPSRPYILCITTKGINTRNMADSISSISQFVFQEVSSQTQ